MNEELVELTSEISLKQKLIEELETSQKRLHIMKQQYETKLLALEQRIVSTEEERDKVLKSLTPGSGDSPEKVNRIKQEYQEKYSNKLSMKALAGWKHALIDSTSRIGPVLEWVFLQVILPNSCF